MTLDAHLQTPCDDFELLDFGTGRKLERFGPYVLDRPDPRAQGPRHLDAWVADWVYTGHVSGGRWVAQRQGLPREWTIKLADHVLNLQLDDGAAVGVRPEDVVCWRWIFERLRGCYDIDDLRVLNLFAGTGGATLAATRAGANVAHVSVWERELSLARRNVSATTVRFVHEDVRTFVEHALRDGERYHLIVLDPPTFTRGKQKAWDIRVDLQHVIKELPRLITPDCRGIWLSLWGRDWSADSVGRLLSETLPGRTVESLELGIATAGGRLLSGGVAARWYDDSPSAITANMTAQPLAAAQLEERLDVYLDPVLSSRRTAAAPASGLAALDRDRQEFVLRWVEIIVRTNAEMAYQFSAHAAAALEQMDESAVEAWIIHAMDVYDTAGLHPGISVLQAVETFARESRDRARGVPYDEVAGVIELFVQGLNGRKLKIDAGQETCTDTETLYLPAIVTRFAERADNFQLYKIMACYLWAQCWFGTFCEPIGHIIGRFADPDRALRLFHTLETLRLSACIARTLPGVHREMRRLTQQFDESMVPPGWEAYAARLASPAASAADSAALLEEVYARQSLAPRLCFQGRLKPDLAEQARAARLAREKDQFRRVIAQILAELRELDGSPGADEQERPRRFSVRKIPGDESAENQTYELQLDGQPLAPPPEVQGLMESIIQDLGKIPDDYLVPAGEGRYRMRRHEGDEEDLAKDVWSGTYHEKGAHLYNEWDCRRRHYRKNWCVLREIEVGEDSPVFVGTTLIKYTGLVKEIRRTFEALRGEQRLLKKQPHGDDVDIDAVVEAYGDVRSGIEMTDRLFTKMHKVERSIAVMFMVDMSGSTKGWINDAEREALVLLCEALETLGDRYAIYGFSGMTRKRCELYRVKRFEDAYDAGVKARISGIQPRDYTRMGVTIRHLTRLLERLEARTKLLITLSDGKPDDYDGYRGEYGIEDTRMALIEAKRSGIHPFCITIDREAHDYLPHMYGAVNYIVVDDVRKLPLKVSDIYRRLTT